LFARRRFRVGRKSVFNLQFAIAELSLSPSSDLSSGRFLPAVAFAPAGNKSML
jgi:hypothetical protein